MSAKNVVPPLLWKLANGLLGVAVVGTLALALALARGAADPPRAGPVWLFDDFKGELSRWTLTTTGPATLYAAQGALVAEFEASAAGRVVALTPSPTVTDFSIEIAGTPTENGIAYGLVFDWLDAEHYSAVLVNGNGYAEAYRQNGAGRVVWFAWQQWPHIFAGDNRVRVERRGEALTIRINDEWLTEAHAPATLNGTFGVWAQSLGHAGRIVFSWVTVWAEAPGP